MSLGLWVLVIPAAAGLLLILAGAIAALRPAMRVKAHLNEIQQSRLMMSLQGLQREGTRFQAMSRRVEPLRTRTTAAVSEIKSSAALMRQTPGADALAQAGAEISALAEDLR